MTPVYYNEVNADACAKLQALMQAGLIPWGHIDNRSIQDVTFADVRGYAQCHFFAGIGIWAAALHAAGWPSDARVWTGSCPCQPFSSAGKGAGFADERHLWPDWLHLIRQRRPPILLGEQVAGRDGLAWFDLVRTDLEAAAYACGGVDSPACGYGAPHRRQRLYWVGYAGGEGLSLRQRSALVRAWGRAQGRATEQPGGTPGGAAHSDGQRFEPGAGTGLREDAELDLEPCGGAGGVAQPEHGGRAGRDAPGEGSGAVVPPGACGGVADAAGPAECPGPTNGFWRDADWISCRDGKWRPVEPGTSPLANGVAGRVGALRAYGNGIVLPQAITFAKIVKELLLW